MIYKIKIENRDYTEWGIIEKNSTKEIKLENISPIKDKLFNQDVFTIEDNKAKLLHSTTRSMKCIPGVIILQDNKTYGKKGRKYYYKCIPDDKRFPIFLVAHKNVVQFNKVKKNKYITFKFLHWDSKFPIGMIQHVIGEIDTLNNFYEYQLYCKSLYASIQDFTKKTMNILRERSEEEFVEHINKKYPNIEQRHNLNIFTIDPKSSKDFDDATSIQEKDDVYIISIYIANVAIWLDTMSLWESFTRRVSTIYLPDRKRPMLPTILSDGVCSLVEKRKRFALTMDITLDKKTNEMLDFKFLNTCITVKKNLRYDTQEMEEYKDYKKLLNVVKIMNKNFKYVENINTCHDLIAYLMILMNYKCAKTFVENKKGLFRGAELNKSFVVPKNASTGIQKFLKMWNSFGGVYMLFPNLRSHDMLELDAYIHITSPIRRLPDLLNIIQIMDILDLMKMSEKSKEFYNGWTNDKNIDYINQTIRSIRKVQNNCSLLNMLTQDKELINKQFYGYMFEKIKRNDNLFQYMVYIEELNMVKRYTSRHDIPNQTTQTFKLYIFSDEIRAQKKIRLELIILPIVTSQTTNTTVVFT
tara:strand:+ start:1855 stop:3603 length:1749 start_codon:yes stop_codon:yes gene_type:complete